MIFEGKYERARKLQKEQNAARAMARGEGHEAEEDLEPADIMEKGDMFAMVVAAMLTFLPAALIVLGLLAAAGYFFIVR